ncbi:hypothetical protein Kisp01_12470 [Kineosporia sp. NBRC 101677]|nr:hypothetical protein Kisp01_12470 [Kineosporia sp. NBRC 101677]
MNCTLGKKRVLWKKSKKAWALVGTKTVSLPAHVAFSQSKTLHRESTFSTTVTANTSVSGSVKAGILGSLETELNVGLEALRSSTKSLSMTETFSVPGAKKARDFAFFKGVRRGTGSYVYQVCTQINQAEDSRTWSTRAKGKASGWSGEWYGAIDCSKKQKSGSIKALVRAQAC